MFRPHGNCKIRTPDLTPPATDAFPDILHKGISCLVSGQSSRRAEGHTDPARFAPRLEDINPRLFFFLFRLAWHRNVPRSSTRFCPFFYKKGLGTVFNLYILYFNRICQRFSMSAEPHSEHFTFFAPSICLARSYVTIFCKIVFSRAWMIP